MGGFPNDQKLERLDVPDILEELYGVSDNEDQGSIGQAEATADTMMEDIQHKANDENEQILNARAGATADTIMEDSQEGGKSQEPQLFSFGDAEVQYNHNGEDEDDHGNREGNVDDDEDD